MSARALTSEFQTAWCLRVCPRISPRIAGAGRSIRCFVRGRHLYQYESPVSRWSEGPDGIANRINESCTDTLYRANHTCAVAWAHKGGALGHHWAMGAQGNDSSQTSARAPFAVLPPNGMTRPRPPTTTMASP